MGRGGVEEDCNGSNSDKYTNDQKNIYLHKLKQQEKEDSDVKKIR